MSPEMPLKASRSRSVAATWLACVVAGILLGIFARWLVPAQIEADHPKNPDQKIGTINGFEADNFCVTVMDSSMSFDTALNNVRSTLLHNDGWDGLKGGKLLLGKNTIPPNPDYTQRLDFNADTFINIADINAMRPPIFNLLVPCTP